MTSRSVGLERRKGKLRRSTGSLSPCNPIGSGDNDDQLGAKYDEATARFDSGFHFNSLQLLLDRVESEAQGTAPNPSRR